MFTIGELSRRTGLAPSAIRYYEEFQLIKPVSRSSGKRLFDESAVAQLNVIQLAKQTGFSLKEIRQLVNNFGAERWRRLATTKLREIETTMANLRAMSAVLEALLECDCFDLQACGRVLQKRRHENVIGAVQSRSRSRRGLPGSALSVAQRASRG